MTIDGKASFCTGVGNIPSWSKTPSFRGNSPENTE